MCLLRIRRVTALFCAGQITNLQALRYLKYVLKTDELTEYVFKYTVLKAK